MQELCGDNKVQTVPEVNANTDTKIPPSGSHIHSQGEPTRFLEEESTRTHFTLGH